MRISVQEIDRLLRGRHDHPHRVLGMHPATVEDKQGLVVRVYLRDAISCEVLDVGSDPVRPYPLGAGRGPGFFEGFILDRAQPFRYRLRVQRTNGEYREFFDPYAFLPTLSDHDLYLFNEGTDHEVYRKLGAHPRVHEDVSGVSFAVWAPSAKRVSVVGDFNGWDGRFHPMRPLGSSGVWELFIPGLEEGSFYKFEILDGDSRIRIKSDPYATYFESPPNNASIIHSVAGYPWGDGEWMSRRRKADWLQKPVSIYEMHFGSWKRHPGDGGRPFTYREIAPELIEYLNQMGYTHVEFMPLAEFPFDGSWGYQVTGFYAPTHRYGTPQDFMYLVDQLHQAGFGVILDWVPAHFPKDAFALAEFDGTALYEHADPRQGYHHDWGTLIFNYGRMEVRTFLVGSALAWLDRYHIDGLRVDAVASMLYLDYSRPSGEWVPNQFGGRENLDAIAFLRYVNDVVHRKYPGVLMIAEESTSWGGVTSPTSKGGLGFDLKWNMGWMHDTLEYFKKNALYRKWHHHQMTFGRVYQESERFNLAFSHDEVVHGKASMLLKMGADQIPEKARNLRALYAWMWGWPGKKTLFMGSDFGQSSEWDYDRSLDWHLLQYLDHDGIRLLVADLNRLYHEHPSMARLEYEHERFCWVNHEDGENSVISFVRLGDEDDGSDHLIVVGNFTPVSRPHYRVGVPVAGQWRESINTDSKRYGGTGDGQPDGVRTEEIPWNGQPYSIDLRLPGLSVLILRPSVEPDS